MGKTAGDLEDRIRNWISSKNREKLTSEHIWELMTEAGEELAEIYDLWFLKVWGSTERGASSAVWTTRSIPPPRASSGAQLTAGQILAGSTPVNNEYLRALPYPDGLLRPFAAYYGPISNNIELAFLLEEEFKESYPLGTAATGTPVAYSLSGDSILLGPAPSLEVEINVQGYYYPQELADDGDENEFTTYAHRLLVYSTQNLLIKYQYEEEFRADLYRNEYQRALRAALAQSGRVSDVARQSRFVRKG